MTEPRILVLGQQDRDIDFSHVYSYLNRHDTIDVKVFAKADVKQLRKTLSKLNTANYDRVILDLPFSKTVKAVSSIRKLPGLIIYEEDACQNFLPTSKWRGAFEKYYRALPQATLVMCGYNTADRYRALGLQPHVIPKGYDDQALRNTGTERDINLAFIGRTQSKVYSERLALLEAVGREFELATLRTASRNEYCDTLNRINLFLSADVGLGEYMAKNFEAMACGCTVIACYQGGAEEEKLGLRDMENIVLYTSPEEAIAKIHTLQAEPALARQIAAAGQALAEAKFSHTAIADQLIQIAKSPVPGAPDEPENFLRRALQGIKNWR